MKYLLTLILSFTFHCFFAQVEIPETSTNGTIITVTDLKIPYRNLQLNGDKVNYTNAETNIDEFLFVNSIKSVEVSSKKGNSLREDLVKINQKEEQNYISNSDYIAGKKLNDLGTGFLVGGGACFLVGGILNLSNSNKTVSASEASESNGSPIPLIIGLAGMGTGLIMKISGKSKMKRAKNTAQFTPAKKEYYVVANNNGFGITMNF